MNQNIKRLTQIVSIIFICFIWVDCWGFEVTNDVGKIDITGRIYTQGTWRTEGSKGFTAPETDSWDLVQHRNMLMAECKWKINHNFKLFGSARIVYDGLHDYGATQYKPYTSSAIEGEGREWYADINAGRFFFRLGRQNLSWGESDLFRLLDGINPLDMTFGILYEELDDRREPIQMARVDIDLGNFGFLQNITFEGFLGEGKRQAPVAKAGTPYYPPMSALPIRVKTEEPDYEDARGGFRFLGLSGDVSWSVGHYWSYPDSPTPVFVYEMPNNILSTILEMQFKKQQTTGASASFFTGWAATQTVVRTEIAYVWDEGVFLPSKSMPTNSLVVPGLDLPLPGKIHEVGAFKWLLGLDNNIWVRSINKRNTFFVSLQAFGRHIANNWDEHIKQAVQEYPSGEFVRADKNEYTFTGIMNTKYMNGNLTPEILLAYDPAGVWFFQPSLKYRWGNWEPMIRYSMIDGSFYNFGFFRDRDQLSVRLTYYFN